MRDMACPGAGSDTAPGPERRATRAAILVVDRDPAGRARLRRAAEAEGEVRAAATAEAARATLRDEWIHVLLIADRGGDAASLCAETAARWPDIVRVALTDDPALAAEADLALAPEEAPARLAAALRSAARLFRLQREHDRLRAEAASRRPRRGQADRLRGFDRILRAPGSPMEAVCRAAAEIAAFDVPALILGETGVGKELLARAIHDGSLRSDRPFFAVNCGAIPDTLLESELFGHRRGAFTGAHADRAGLFAEAHGGAVFLDEIGDTSPAFQVKLLRFLQEGEIRPVGADETRRVDVRVIAATNRDLRCEVEAGRFRDDLYWRLEVAPIRVPPLRERPEDVPPLVEGLLARAVADHGKRVRGVEPAALDRLAAHDWPGNVRELENEVTRLLIRAAGDWLAAADLSPEIAAGEGASPPCDGTLKAMVERLEARAIREALARAGGNKSRAAEALGLSRVGLRAKLERYGLEDRPALAAAE